MYSHQYSLPLQWNTGNTQLPTRVMVLMILVILFAIYFILEVSYNPSQSTVFTSTGIYLSRNVLSYWHLVRKGL